MCTTTQAIAGKRSYDRFATGKETAVPSTLIVVVVVLALWLLGVVTSYTLGGLIHILLVVAVVIVMLRIVRGRNRLRL